MTKHVDLDHVRRLCEAATPGPWFWDAERREIRNQTYEPDGEYDDLPHRIVETDGGYYNPGEHDAAFIVAARTLVPEMAAEIAELRARVASLEADLSAATEFLLGEMGAVTVSTEDGYPRGPWLVFVSATSNFEAFDTRDEALARARELAGR